MPLAAAQDHHAADALLLQHPRRPGRILLRGLYLEVQQLHLRPEHSVALQALAHRPANHEGLRHEQDPLYAQALRRQHDALADVHLLVVVYRRRIGDEAPDILARRRVGYDAYRPVQTQHLSKKARRAGGAPAGLTVAWFRTSSLPPQGYPGRSGCSTARGSGRRGPAYQGHRCGLPARRGSRRTPRR